MYINAEVIIKTASVITSLMVITGFMFSGYRWFLKQAKYDKEIEELNEELNLICHCMSACLDGLIQLGANHSVPKAKKRLDEYIINRAHEQEV